MAERKTIFRNKVYTAWFMGVSVQAFDKWNVQPAGKNPETGEVMYDLKQVVAWRLEKAAERGSSDLTDERTKATRIKNEMAQLELDLMKEKYLMADQVEKVWSDQIVTFKARLSSLGSRVARRVVGKKVREAEKIINASVGEVLEELSEYEYGRKLNGTKPGSKTTAKSKRKAKTAKKANGE